MQAAVGSVSITSTYDLLAVQPRSERTFALACNSLDVDIISLDLSRRLPFRFKPALIKAALARGLTFEVGSRAGWLGKLAGCQAGHMACLRSGQVTGRLDRLAAVVYWWC
jgi:hypothetical protein